MHRLFVALRPSAPTRAHLLDLAGGVDGARWQDDAQLHLTLRYIGEVEPALANNVAEELERVAVVPFPVALRGVGHFERKGVPNTLWAGITWSEPLAVLQGRVERACRRAGCAPEGRKFMPHITIARLGRSAGPVGGWLEAHGVFMTEPWLVDHMILYESHLSRHGADYQPVVRYRLDG